MQLLLDRNDLLPDRRNMACSETSLKDFKPEVQAAIRVVGEALLKVDKGHNKILAPDPGLLSVTIGTAKSDALIDNVTIFKKGENIAVQKSKNGGYYIWSVMNQTKAFFVSDDQLVQFVKF